MVKATVKRLLGRGSGSGETPDLGAAMSEAAAPAPAPSAPETPPLEHMEASIRKFGASISNALSAEVILHVFRSPDGLDLMMLREDPVNRRQQSYPMTLSLTRTFEGAMTLTIRGAADRALGSRPVEPLQNFHPHEVENAITAIETAVRTRLSDDENAKLDLYTWPRKYPEAAPGHH